MKEYKKLIKELSKDDRFELIKTTTKSTVKLKHIESGELYSIHPGNKAVEPLKRWTKKFDKDDRN